MAKTLDQVDQPLDYDLPSDPDRWARDGRLFDRALGMEPVRDWSLNSYPDAGEPWIFASDRTWSLLLAGSVVGAFWIGFLLGRVLS